jgi:outer membrane protein
MRPLSFLTAIGLCLLLYGKADPADAEPQSIDLSLAEAVQTALLKNLGLRLSKEDVVSAEGAALAAEGAFDYQLSGEVGAGAKDEAPVTAIEGSEEKTAAFTAGVEKRFTPGTEVGLNWNNGNLDTDSDIYFFDPVYSTDLTLDVRQPILRGFGRETQLADLNSARTQLEASSYLVDSEAADLAAEVKQAYWELVFAHQNLEVLELSLTLAKQLRDETATRIEAGKLAEIDLFQPESEVAQREQDLITGEREIGFAEDNLKLLLNSEDWLIPFNPVDLPATEPVYPEIRQVFENAMAQRPDLQAAALQVKALQYQLDKADNDRKPALDLLGSLGFGARAEDYSSALDDSVSDSDTRWQLALTFSRPLDNSLAEGQYRQTLAAHNKSRTSLELLKLQITRTVRVTVRDVELALKAIDATRKTSIATRKRLEAEQIKFEAGRSTTLDVLIAQQDYARALSTENRTKVVYAQTLAELDRIQGTITIP